MYRKQTLRNLPPQTRKLARLYNDLESVSVKIKHLIPVMAAFEHDSKTLFAVKKLEYGLPCPNPQPALPLFEDLINGHKS